MSYKMVALDVDGTLLNSNSLIEERTIKTINECMKNNLKVIIASGREYKSIEKIVDLFKFKDEQITLNGAVIIRGCDKKIIKTNPLNKEKYLKNIRLLRKLNVPYMVFDEEKPLAEQNFEDLKILKECNMKEATIIDNCEDIINPIKIISFAYNEREIGIIRNSVKEFNVQTIRTGGPFLEIMEPDVSKGTALKYIAEIYNIKKEEIIAMGDSENDIEMLKYAGMGIAMGNAFENVKKEADYITDTNDNYGVVKALHRFVFNV